MVKLDAKDVVLVRLSLWSVTLVKAQLTAGLVHTVRSMLSLSSQSVSGANGFSVLYVRQTFTGVFLRLSRDVHYHNVALEKFCLLIEVCMANTIIVSTKRDL